MSTPATTSDAVQHLPVFLTHTFLDAALRQQRDSRSGSVLLSQLSSLHCSLSFPLTLFSYLFSVLQHLALHVANAGCLSPSADAAAIAAFSRSLCRGLLQHHKRRPRLFSLLPPLTEAVSHLRLAFPHRSAGDELIEQLLVSYVAVSVSQSLLQRHNAADADVSSASTSPSTASQPSSLAAWLELVQSFSDPTTASISPPSSLSVSPLPLTSKLLLAPVSSLAAAAKEQPDNAQAAALSIAAELAAAAAFLSSTASAPSCLTAFAHCLQAVVAEWIIYCCAPPHLLPSLSPFPTISPPTSLLTVLAAALPSHCVLRLVLDLIRMLHSPTSRFPAAYTPISAAELPERPSSPSTAASVSSAASVCQCLHTLLTSSSVSLSAVLDALLKADVSEIEEREAAESFTVAVSFLSCLLSSALPASYASAFHAYLLHQLTSCSRIAVPLLSALSASLYSVGLPLFEPTVSACRRWKEAHDRDAAHATAAQSEGQPQQQQEQQRILELILCMARKHRTISAMFGIAASNSSPGAPPSPSSTTVLLSSSGYDSWCALVRLYTSSPASCLRAVRLYVSRSAAQERDWVKFLSSSLNAQLFQHILQFSSSSAPAVAALVTADNSSTLPVQEAGSSSSQQPCAPSLFHSFSSLLSELLQRRCVGSDCISACLEQPPAALTSLLTIPTSVAASRHLSPVHLRSLLSPFLHFSPSSSSRFPLQSFAPPHLPALFSLVLSYVSSLSSASASCLCLVTVVASYSPAYSRCVLAFALSAHLRRHLPLLSSCDPVVSKTAAKAVSLALLLCEEAQLEVDAVWDEQMSQLCLLEVTQWAVRHTRIAMPEPDGDAAVDVSLPPLLSLLERAVVAESQGGHWLPQLSRRVSASSPSSLRVGSLYRSRKLLQLLSSLLLSPPSSPPSLLQLARCHLPAAVQDRLQLLAAHVQRMQSGQSEAADCLCEEREMQFAHGERLTVSKEKAMQAEAFELQLADGQAVDDVLSRWSHGGELDREALPAASHQQPGFGWRAQQSLEEAVMSEPLKTQERSLGRKRRRQTDEDDAGFVSRAQPKRLEAEVAEDNGEDADSERQPEPQRQLRSFLRSAPPDPLCPRCAVRQSDSSSCCSSLSLPPFHRWLRWLVLVSFLTPMPVERCYAHVLAHYAPLQPLHQLLSDAFSVVVASVRERRRRQLCPVLSVDLPPLMEAMLAAALLPSALCAARPHWLLHCLLSLLSPLPPADAAPTSSTPLQVLSVADMLRALPSSSVALLPPSSPPPATSDMLRLLSAVQMDAFMVSWLLRAAASYCKQTASPHHRGLLVTCLRNHFSLLQREQHETAVLCMLDDQQLLFLRELQTSQHQRPAAAESVDAVQVREALTAQAGLSCCAAVEEELQDGGDAAVVEVEVDWSTACDDDANGALLSRTERERKGSRRGQQSQQQCEAKLQAACHHDDALEEQHQRRSKQAASVTCDAQTQTSPWPAPSLSPTLAEEPQSDLLEVLLPRYDSPLSSSPSHLPSLAAAAGLPPAPSSASGFYEPFDLPDDVDELTGFVVTDEAIANAAVDTAATLRSVDSPASAAASSSAAASLRPPSARPSPHRHALSSYTSPARPATSVPKPLSAHSARATFTPMPRSHAHISAQSALSTPPPATPRPQLSSPSSTDSPVTASSARSVSASPFPHLRSESIVLKRALRPPPITDSSGIAAETYNALAEGLRPRSPWVKRLDEDTQQQVKQQQQVEEQQRMQRRRVLLS